MLKAVCHHTDCPWVLLYIERWLKAPVQMEDGSIANITNANTKRAYKIDVEDFASYVSLARPEDMHLVTRAHVIAWRNLLAGQSLPDSTIRLRLAAVPTLFAFLTDNNAIDATPISRMKQPISEFKEGSGAGSAFKGAGCRYFIPFVLKLEFVLVLVPLFLIDLCLL